MREMRLKKREITDPEILREILESCEVVRIGAMDEEGMFIVPMNYGYDVREEDGTLHVCLYLHGAKRRAEGGCICSGSARGGGDGLQP